MNGNGFENGVEFLVVEYAYEQLSESGAHHETWAKRGA
jgi:hypothetical protein